MSKEKSYVLKKITPNLIYKSLKASHDLMEYYQQTGKIHYLRFTSQFEQINLDMIC